MRLFAYACPGGASDPQWREVNPHFKGHFGKGAGPFPKAKERLGYLICKDSPGPDAAQVPDYLRANASRILLAIGLNPADGGTRDALDGTQARLRDFLAGKSEGENCRIGRGDALDFTSFSAILITNLYSQVNPNARDFLKHAKDRADIATAQIISYLSLGITKVLCVWGSEQDDESLQPLRDAIRGMEASAPIKFFRLTSPLLDTPANRNRALSLSSVSWRTKNLRNLPFREFNFLGLPS